MKQIILLLMVLSLPLKSQITEFAPVGAQWSYFIEGSAAGFETSQLVSLKDTSINGVDCRKLGTFHTYGLYNNQVFEGTHFEYVYSDESAVYILVEDGFVKLVDFNSEIGDTIVVSEDGFSFEIGKFAYVVDSIVWEDGYQVLYSTPLDDSVWYLGAFSENYGSKINWRRPFGFSTDAVMTGCCIGGLLCYDNGEEVIKFWENRECNADLVSIESIDIQLKVFPNPATSFVTFYLPSLQKNTKLYLYNSVGQLVAEADIDKEEMNKSMDVSIYPKGMYFWQMEGLMSGKLLVE